jgi:hypothetical protein
MRASVWLLAIGLISVSGCDRVGQQNRPIAPSARQVAPPDPWLRYPSMEFILSGKEIDRAQFAVVTAKEAEALARLIDWAWVELSPKEAEELAGRAVDGTGGRLVLLRGLAWDTPYGAFTLSWRPGEARVNHGCLGRQPLPVVQRAVVARLPDIPGQVYVDLCMAE